jgi:spore coat protein CotH
MKFKAHIRVVAGLSVMTLVMGLPALAASSSTTNSEAAYLADLFDGSVVLRLQIEILPAGMRDLAGNDGDGRHRPSALATVKEGGRVYTNVELHLKGGAGSYRPINNNPGLTLNFDSAAPGQSFHGLKKFSVNNSVQDPTFLNEKICRELFNAAGSPAARAGFATVQLNGRNLGVHVLAEGLNKQFLHQYFENVHGNLYQTHGNQEITDRLDVNSGDDPKNDSGLRALAQAIKEEDPAVRWNRLQQTLDVKRFITFMALEVMLCHWDGYCMNQNNWRVFHDLAANKMVFIAHGMDQMFGTGTMLLAGEQSSAECPIYPPIHGAVADAVMGTPVGRKLYLERLGEVYTNQFRVDALLKRVDELSSVVRGVIAERGPTAVAAYQRKVDSLKAHIEERGKSLAHQLAEAAKPRDSHISEPVHLSGWMTRVQEGQPEFEKGSEDSRPNLLHISAAHSRAAGSWRTRVHLEPGRYRFEGEIRVKGVQPAAQGSGAGLRISGGRPMNEVSGSTEWRPFAYEFQVGGTREIEFICELRANGGEAWFDAEKLQVMRVD